MGDVIISEDVRGWPKKKREEDKYSAKSGRSAKEKLPKKIRRSSLFSASCRITLMAFHILPMSQSSLQLLNHKRIQAAGNVKAPY